jgi:hypothetical protein
MAEEFSSCYIAVPLAQRRGVAPRLCNIWLCPKFGIGLHWAAFLLLARHPFRGRTVDTGHWTDLRSHTQPTSAAPISGASGAQGQTQSLCLENST